MGQGVCVGCGMSELCFDEIVYIGIGGERRVRVCEECLFTFLTDKPYATSQVPYPHRVPILKGS